MLALNILFTAPRIKTDSKFAFFGVDFFKHGRRRLKKSRSKVSKLTIYKFKKVA